MSGVLCYEIEPGDSMHDIYAAMIADIKRTNINSRIEWSMTYVPRYEQRRVRTATLIKARWT